MRRKKRPVTRSRAIWALLLLAVVSASVVHLIGAVNVYDDAYITYRYVENVQRGRGAVYNEGERVFGVTSPLYLLWLIVLGQALPWAALPVLAVTGNLIFLLAACALVFAYVNRIGPGKPAGAVAVLAVILSGPILRVSMGGLEMSLFLALIFGTLLALARGSNGAALWVASLAMLTRPEGTILVAIALLSMLLEKKRRLSGLLGLLPLAVWTAWSFSYYGSPVPHSIIAKSRPLYPLPPGTALLELIREMGVWSAGGFLDGVALFTRGAVTSGGIMLPVIGVAVTGFVLWIRRRAAGASGGAGRWGLPAFLLSMVAFYAVGNPLIFAWYYPPFQACWIVLAVVTCLEPSRTGRAARVVKGAVLALVLLTATTSFLANLAPTDMNLPEYGAVGHLRHEMMASYARAAVWVEQHSAASDRVAAPEIGILGYTADRRILDACGLVSPEAIPFLPVPPEQRGDRQGVISTDFVRETEPEWVVTNPLHAMRSLLASPWFMDRYEEAYRDHAEIEGQSALAILVFRKRP